MNQVILDSIPSPCYVLETEKLLDNLKLLQRIQQDSGAEFILALKGFSMYSKFPLIKKYLSGATASSLHEAMLINQEMNCKAHTYSPAYNTSEFETIQDLSKALTFNSLSQYELFKNQLRKDISYGIRVNPQYAEVATDMYNPCIPGSRLGVTTDQLESLPRGVEGIHFHTLCENDSTVLERTLKAVKARFGHLLHEAKWLNMGGGHLITKKGYDVDLLIRLIHSIKVEYDVKVILEPGSAIAWQTGFLKATVLDIINSQGIEVAILDVSFAAHMPDTLEMPYQPKVRGAETASNKGHTYKLGGNTCLAGDYIGDYSFKEPLSIGDSVIFEDMMHYTMVKTTTFNGVGLPSIGFIENGEFVNHKNFGYETFKDRL